LELLRFVSADDRERHAAMPNGGHMSPWSCPHTSDDEEISTEKIRFRYLGAKVM
jgi:hypothetical protein